MTPSEADNKLDFLEKIWKSRKQFIENLLFCDSEGVGLCLASAAGDQLRELSRKCDSKLSLIKALREQTECLEIADKCRELSKLGTQIYLCTSKIKSPSYLSPEELTQKVAERDEHYSRQSSLLQQLEQLYSPIGQKIQILLEEVSPKED